MRLEERISQNYEHLNDNDLLVWQYILKHKDQCKRMSIQELAASCNLSHTTILRFAKKLGFDGFSELKLSLKWEDEEKAVPGRDELKLYCADVAATMEYLRSRDCSDLFELFDHAERVFAYGTGLVQKNAAEDMKKSFIFLNQQIVNLDGEAEMKVALNYCRDGDLFILLSHSGENQFAVDIAGRLKERGARIVSITRLGNNSLSRISDCHLYFHNHLVRTDERDNHIYMTSQFFMINELLMLKFMEYKAAVQTAGHLN